MSKTRLIHTSLAGALVVGGLLFRPASAPSAAPNTAAPAAAQKSGHVMVTPDELKFVDGPEGLPKGSKVVVIEGDPSKPGPYTLRAEFPANYKIMPHWHPVIEHVTVLSGELYMGSGDKLNEGAAKKLGSGGFAVMPIKYVHFAFTKGSPATLQLHGIGPWAITYVNPADDPRRATK